MSNRRTPRRDLIDPDAVDALCRTLDALGCACDSVHVTPKLHGFNVEHDDGCPLAGIRTATVYRPARSN